MNALTPRQAAFAAAYAKHGVAERAAVEAGYSKKTSGAQASRMLRNDGVRSMIADLQAKATAVAEVDVARVVQELSIIGFSDLAEFATWSENGIVVKDSETLDPVRRRAVVEVSQGQHGVKIKLADKNSALEKLARYLSMFVDKVEHSGEVKTTAPVVNLTIVKPNPKAQGNG